MLGESPGARRWRGGAEAAMTLDRGRSRWEFGMVGQKVTSPSRTGTRTRGNLIFTASVTPQCVPMQIH